MRSHGSSRAPNWVVLKDTSPGHLAAFVSIMIGGYNATTRDTTTIHIGFESGGQPVQFVAGEQVTCAGTTLQPYPGAFEGLFLTAAIAGKSLHCLYTSGQSLATLTFTVPAAPVLLSPQDHAVVTRSASTVVTYCATTGIVLGVVALGPRSKAVAGQNVVSATHTLLDTSAFSPGAGSIALTETFTLPDLQGKAFHGVSGRGNAITTVEVTWV